MNICIIGGGSIGALKPDKYDSPCSENILTHAHALYHLRKNKIINNFCIVESDCKKRKLIKDKWKCKVFTALSLVNMNIDIFVISTPTEIHINALNEILKLKYLPKLVICEKPFTNNINQAKDMFFKYKKRSIPIVVNYIRRFCPTIQNLRKDIINKKYGKVKACNIIYVRGFQRDACHAIDLCNYFFGEYKQGKILGNSSNAYDDYSINDLTVPVWMEFKNCKNVYFTPADGNDYSIFELDILTEKARIHIIDHSKKTNIYYSETEKIYGSFPSMVYKPKKEIINHLENALLILHGNCIEYVNSDNKEKHDLFCTGLDGLKVQEIYNNLLGE